MKLEEILRESELKELLKKAKYISRKKVKGKYVYKYKEGEKKERAENIKNVRQGDTVVDSAGTKHKITIVSSSGVGMKDESGHIRTDIRWDTFNKHYDKVYKKEVVDIEKKKKEFGKRSTGKEKKKIMEASAKEGLI